EDEIQPSVANSLIQQKMALEAEKTKDALNRRLGNRPTKVDLKLRNILRVDSSDSMEQSGLSLEKSINFERTKESVKSILKKRPEKNTLEELNIIKGTLVGRDGDGSRGGGGGGGGGGIRNLTVGRGRRLASSSESDGRSFFSHFLTSEYNRKPDTNATFRKLTPQMKVQIREELNTYKKHEMPVHEQSLRNTCFH
ncbi:hypothetical protein BDK51DRAFT_25422, partial [Blyttiomyces helicus]